MNRLAFQKCIGSLALVSAIAVSQAGIARSQTPAPATPAPATAVGLTGNVDIDAVAQSSKAYLKDKEDLGALVSRLRTISSQLSTGSGLFLASDQMHELAGLYEKEQPTDTEKKRIAELESTGDTRKGELSRLENTAAPTEVQRKRFQELNTMHQQGEQTLQTMAQEFEARLHTKEDDMTKRALVAIREAIGVVAKTKGLTVVFDSKFALYAQVDITADVSKQINK